jgi:hypothetical protein
LGRRCGRGEIKRFIHNVLIQDLVRARAGPWDCATVDGTQKLHSISSLSAADPTQLMVCQLSCFCSSYISEKWEMCLNLEHVTPWRLVKLRPKNMRVVRHIIIDRLEEDDDSQFGGDHNVLADELHIGDNFAMLADERNDKGVPYYVLQCQRPTFVVTARFDCVGEFLCRRGLSSRRNLLPTLGAGGTHLCISLIRTV